MFYDINKNYLGNGATLATTSVSAVSSITIPYSLNSNICWAKIEYRKSSNSSTDMTTINDIMLNIGEILLAYKPYQNQTLPLNLGSIELNKIGTYQDYIYKNNGNWYKKEQIGKYTFTGNEESYTTWTNNRVVVMNIPTNYLKVSNTEMALALCNSYNISSRNNVASADNLLAFYGTQDTSSSGTIVCDSVHNTNTSLKSFFATQYQANTPVILYYVKSTATDIEITNTDLISQLENIDKAQSYNGTTIITSTYDSSNAQMELQVSALKGV